MTLATSKLASIHITDTAFHTLATVPANSTWIIKSIAFADLSGFSNQMLVNVQNASPVFGMALAEPTVPANGVAYWAGWVVLQAGDLIIATLQFGNGEIWVSGSKLSGVV